MPTLRFSSTYNPNGTRQCWSKYSLARISLYHHLFFDLSPFFVYFKPFVLPFYYFSYFYIIYAYFIETLVQFKVDNSRLLGTNSKIGLRDATRAFGGCSAIWVPVSCDVCARRGALHSVPPPCINFINYHYNLSFLQSYSTIYRPLSDQIFFAYIRPSQ